jgi:nicotinate-nucleotide adenylyltransferase
VLGILGGTFDPVHYGHLRPAREAQQALALDEVRFIPAYHPPHRHSPQATAAQRLAMVRLAIADYPGFLVDEREIRRGGLSYTVPTIESLRAELGARPLALLMGADAFLELETWHRWQRLPELAHLVVMNRPGSPLPGAGPELPGWARPRLCRDPQELAGAAAGRVFFQAVTPVDISATRIRAAIARGESVEGLVPPAVWEYIHEQGLYGARRGQSGVGA